MRDEVVQNVVKALDAAGVPRDYQSECLDEIFSSHYYDMRLTVDIMQRGARFIIKERGAELLNIYLDNVELIEYLIISEVLQSYFWHFAASKTTNEEKKYVDSSFEKIGGSYLKFRKEKVTVWNVDGR